MTAPQPDTAAGAELAEEAQLPGGPGGAAKVEPAVVLRLPPPVPALRWATVVRVIATAVAAPVIASYAVAIALVALLTITANAGWSLAGTLRAAAPLWLATHQVPLTITAAGGTAGVDQTGGAAAVDGAAAVGPTGGVAAPLGVLPLLPTIGLVVLIAWAATGAAVRLSWRTPARLELLAAVFAVVHAVLGIAVALLAPLPQADAAPVPAALGCATVAGLAAGCGGLRAVGFAAVAPWLPPWALHGVRAGVIGLFGLITGGAVCTFGGLLISAGAARDILAGWGGVAGGQLGLTVVSLVYLPNAVVAAMSWIAGPGLSIGAVSVTPFGATTGTLPAVPLLAALPESGPAPWRALVFVLPVLAGVLVGRHCRRLPGDLTDRLHAVVTAGAVAAAACFGLALLVGGRLGGGAFDPVRIPSASFAIAAFVWLVLPAAMIVGLTDRSTRGSSLLDTPDEMVSDDEPVPDRELGDDPPASDAKLVAENEPAPDGEPTSVGEPASNGQSASGKPASYGASAGQPASNGGPASAGEPVTNGEPASAGEPVSNGESASAGEPASNDGSALDAEPTWSGESAPTGERVSDGALMSASAPAADRDSSPMAPSSPDGEPVPMEGRRRVTKANVRWRRPFRRVAKGRV